MKLLLAAISTLVLARAQGLVELQEQKTVALVQEHEKKLAGSLGFYAIDLATGRGFGYHSGTVFPTASSIKIAIMAQLYRSDVPLTDKITVQPSDSVGGSGHLQILLRNGPVTMTLKDLITAMIETSDNTATNQCIRLAGMEKINAMLMEMGLRQTKLQRIMLDSQAARGNRENISTPADMAHLVEMIYKGKFRGANEMLSTLKLVDADMRKVIPEAVAVAAKPGELPGARCETGIVFLKKHPFALSVMSSFLDSNENPVPFVARLVFEHFQKLEVSNEFGNRLP